MSYNGSLTAFFSGKMQTTTIGPRRSVAPQRQASRNSRLVTGSTAEGQRSQDVVTLSHSLAANTLTHDTSNLATSVAGESIENVSITPPSVSGTINNMFGENIPSHKQMHFGKSAVDNAGLESNLDVGSHNENVQKKFQSLTGSTIASQGNAFLLGILN